MKNLKFISLLNALATVAYIAFVALVMKNGEMIFGNMSNFLGPIAFLMLFVLSATITSSLVLGGPILMYLDNRKSEAVKLFIYTVSWFFLIMVIMIGVGMIV
jgi:hypothetical protein